MTKRAPRRGSGRPTPLRILVAAAPAAALVAWLLAGHESRRAVLDRFPDGAGARLVRVVVALAVLAALAWGALPVTYHPERWCRFGADWIRGKSGAARVALGPALLLVELFRCLALALFLATAIAVILMFLLALLYAVWVVMPGFLGGHEALWARLVEWGLLPGGPGA